MSKELRMEAVWRERARRLSQSPKLAGAGQSTLPVVVVGIGKERYGMPIEDVAEVFPPLRPTPVPGAHALFSGVVNVPPHKWRSSTAPAGNAWHRCRIH